MKKRYKVAGMTCCGCANAVEQAIKAAVPGAEVEVDVATGEVTIEGMDDDQQVETIVEDAGFAYGGLAT